MTEVLHANIFFVITSIAVVIFTILGGGYVLLKRSPLKVLLWVLGLFVSMMHQGFALLIMLGFSGVALGRGIQLIIWGIKAQKIHLMKIQLF